MDFPTNIVDFGGFDSSTILSLWGEIPRPIGDLPESLTQAMLVGVMLVGRLGISRGMHILYRGRRHSMLYDYVMLLYDVI